MNKRTRPDYQSAEILASSEPGKSTDKSTKNIDTDKQTRLSPSTLSGRERVVIEFQRAMLEMTNSVIRAQEEVMLAYLRGEQELPAYAEVNSINNKDRYILDEQEQTVQPSLHIDNGSNHQEETVTDIKYSATRASAPAKPVEVEVYDTTAQVEEITAEKLIASLLEIVSERTGYPPELLDPSLDMEADLGIDSIKRVEILNGLRKQLPESKQAQMEESIEQVIGIKNLEGIMQWIKEEFPEDAGNRGLLTLEKSTDS